MQIYSLSAKYAEIHVQFNFQLTKLSDQTYGIIAIFDKFAHFLKEREFTLLFAYL